MKYVVFITTGVLLIVLAADLLYLYDVGEWYDNNIIEFAEVIALLFIIVLGFLTTAIGIKLGLDEESKK